MRYLKKFNESKSLSKADLEMCFDGFVDMECGFMPRAALLTREFDHLKGRFSDTEKFVIHIECPRSSTIRHHTGDDILVNRINNDFEMTDDIVEEAISSIGKAKELGFKFMKIEYYSNNVGNYIFNSGTVDNFPIVNKFSPTSNNYILTDLKIYFYTNPVGITQYKLSESKEYKGPHLPDVQELDVIRCFQEFEDFASPPYEFKIQVIDMRDHRKRATWSDSPPYLKIIITKSWGEHSAIPFRLTNEIKGELISSIGKAEDLNLKLRSINILQSERKDKYGDSIHYKYSTIDEIDNDPHSVFSDNIIYGISGTSFQIDLVVPNY